MAERHVLWTAVAEGDLLDIVEYIGREDPGAAQAVFDKLRRRASSLAAQTLRGRIVPELIDTGDMRSRELIERPWRLLYRIDADVVLVFAVLDARRDLQTLLLQRLARS